jgi:predicted component of type VI protein secretion system
LLKYTFISSFFGLFCQKKKRKEKSDGEKRKNKTNQINFGQKMNEIAISARAAVRSRLQWRKKRKN